MKTEQIIQSNLDSFMDCFYGYLIKEGMYSTMPDVLKKLFVGIEPSDIAFILDGTEDKYFADYTYFCPEQYDNKVYWAIPYGEIEEEAQYIDKNEIDDWTINGQYAYQVLPAITIVYDLDEVKKAIENYNS